MNTAATVARAQEALRVGRSARIVQHARLRPARDEDAAQMRFAVEDALNTADFADCGRLILVRRLHLPALPPRAGPALVARAMETAWRALAARAVAASHPAARAAEAVYFGSRFEARLAWLELVATEADATAWYWPAALPELELLLAVGDGQAALSAVIEVLLHEGVEQAAQALCAWPDEAVAALARRAPETVNRRLMQAFARSAVIAPEGAMQAAVRAAPVAGHVPAMAWRKVARRVLDQAPLSESAASWLAAVWLAPSSGGALNPAHLRAIAKLAARPSGSIAAGVPAQAPQGRETVRPQAPSPGAPPAAQRGRADIASPVLPAPEGAAKPPSARRDGSAARHVESGLPGHSHAPLRTTQPGRTPLALPWLADAAATGHGGLMCLLNLLHALHFEAWLARQPPAARPHFVNALLAQTLRDAGAPPDDPQHAWFWLSSVDAAHLAATELVDDASATDTCRALRHWRWRMRRALRRRVGIDLAALVQRQAWVAATATHFDVVFPLDSVDLRLRRHGLDSDPGWVPWFGHIVAFHFVAAHLLPPMEAGPALHCHG